MKVCPSCQANLKDEAIYCSKCGSKLTNRINNYCENPDCIRCQDHYCFDEDDRYCDKCGKLTSIGRKIEEMI